MPYEIERFVLEKTKYGILVRTGGTLDDLRSLIAGGFPVIIEKGLDGDRAQPGLDGALRLSSPDTSRTSASFSPRIPTAGRTIRSITIP